MGGIRWAPVSMAMRMPIDISRSSSVPAVTRSRSGWRGSWPSSCTSMRGGSPTGISTVSTPPASGLASASADESLEVQEPSGRSIAATRVRVRRRIAP